MKTIGIMGCSITNPNMGCAALHYSLIRILEDISKDTNEQFKYICFDFGVDNRTNVKICNELNINPEIIKYINMPICINHDSIKGYLRLLKYLGRNNKAYSIIKKCDVVIDLTQGDSFSDIYGANRFYQWTSIKEKIEKMSIPLILGPQTYGPFYDDEVLQYAKKIINSSELVISRDEESKEYISKYCSKDIIAGTDLAFKLPYTIEQCTKKKIRIGINPSGLLASKKTDVSDFNNDYQIDYDRYIKELIDYLVKERKYDIHLIPHVGNEAIDCFGGIKGVTYHETFTSPIKAKNLISSMDIFVGARMHATIAALSSGVATIPTAYSMKFSGVFEGIGYPYLIDLRNMTTVEALKKTKDYISDYKELKETAIKCQDNINLKYNTMKSALQDCICKL